MKSQVVLLCSTLVWSIAVPAQVRLNNSNKVERIKNANEIRLSSPQITNLKNQFDVGVSEFYFASQSISDPDCKGAHCWVWSYETSVWRNLDKDTNNKDWTEMVFWRKIPKTAVYGKFEISTSPFSGNDDTIVQSGIVETNGQNELKFNIPYSVSNERKSTPKPGDQVTRVKPGENQEIKLSNVYKNLIKNNPSPIVNPVYFVRITPLDASKNPIGISSNSISLTQVLYKFYNPPKITYDRYKDYVITGINYVPVQQPNGNSDTKNIVFSIENQSERKDIYCENCSPGFSSNTLKFNQFEEAIVRIPNLENVGDKTKILVVLKPQESWVDRDPKTNKIRSIGKPLPYNEFVTPVSPTYEGATHSEGFYTLNTKSQLTFKISNLKIADGVNTVFNQP